MCSFFFQISYYEKGGPLAKAPKPITSYMVKSVLFWLLTGDKDQSNPWRWRATENSKVSSTRPATDQEVTDMKHTPAATPRWMDLVDLNEHVEEARVWAVKIIQTMLHLAKDVQGLEPQDKMLLPFFEVRHDTFLLHEENKDSVIDLCQVLLNRLDENVFYDEK